MKRRARLETLVPVYPLIPSETTPRLPRQRRANPSHRAGRTQVPAPDEPKPRRRANPGPHAHRTQAFGAERTQGSWETTDGYWVMDAGKVADACSAACPSARRVK